MINDLITLFKKAYEEHGDELILSSYKPKNGLYIRINKDKSKDKLLIDKTPPADIDLYKWFQNRDYYSVLIDMNKPVDTKKKIHSNNYLTLFIKKDIFPIIGENPISKEEYTDRVNDYFNILKEPKKKLSDKSSKLLLKYMPLDTDLEQLEKNREYLINNIEQLAEYISQEDFKGYVSIFFEEDISVYKQESMKYLIPKIYNKNDFNIISKEKVMGLSNSNMGTNDKKPYMELKASKFKAPYRVTIEAAIIIKKFFDWLSFQFDKVQYREILIPEDYDFKGAVEDAWQRNYERACYYLYITKGKEVAIEDYESLPCYKQDITFNYKNILGIETKENDQWLRIADKHISTLHKLETETDYTFFNKRLMKNYFTEPKINQKEFSKNMLNLFIISRKAFHSFFRKGIDNDLRGMIDKISMELVKEHIRSGEGLYRAAHAFNLRIAYLNYFSLGGEQMADKITELIKTVDEKISLKKEYVSCQNDAEFYFTAGQLAYYIMMQSEAKRKNLDMFEPFMKIKDSTRLKHKLRQMADVYKHALSAENYRFKNAFAMIQGYETEEAYEKNQDMFYAGLLSSNIFYKENENKKVTITDQKQQEEVASNEND